MKLVEGQLKVAQLKNRNTASCMNGDIMRRVTEPFT
jgi:hypothetical protein